MRWVRPSEVKGTLSAPASKSLMIRATAAALLCKGETRIINPSFCDDALAGLNIAEALGAQVEREDKVVRIKGGIDIQKTGLNCNESGLCMRMFTPIAALQNKLITISGTGSLMTRPMGMMETPLNQLGAYCRTNGGYPPIQVKGPIKGGKIMMDASLSSQILTGLLTVLPICKPDSELIVNNLKSKPYVAMTLSLLNHFSISISSEKDFKRFLIKGNQHFQNTTYAVEGDWSSASYLLVAGAIGGKVTVRNLQTDSLQADKQILEALESIGSKISILNDTVAIERDQLNSFEFDATECPDLFPSLVVLACCCSGQSLIKGVERLRYKESDRAQALITEFIKTGAKINIDGNRMEIEGAQLKGGIIDSHNDHRIAMAGAIAALSSEQGMGILGWQSVSKSYPGFFEDLKSIGGEVQ